MSGPAQLSLINAAMNSELCDRYFTGNIYLWTESTPTVGGAERQQTSGWCSRAETQ